jgi:uroporphyrinogen III methyltransferase/synthase
VVDGRGADGARAALRAGEVDAVTFTSSSTVTNFIEALGAGFVADLPWGRGLAAASIGPITSETARGRGIPVTIEAARYTIEGLVESMASHFAGGRGAAGAASRLRGGHGAEGALGGTDGISG